MLAICVRIGTGLVSPLGGRSESHDGRRTIAETLTGFDVLVTTSVTLPSVGMAVGAAMPLAVIVPV
jgi:hypothetical protein